MNIETAVECLHHGSVIAHPTETCYGLACDLCNPQAVSKLFAIKSRPLDQPVSALFSSVEQAKQYVQWNPMADALAQQYLPGPLTIILPARSDAPHRLCVAPGITNQELGMKIGVRISSHPIARELVEKFGKPISTTSANVHGMPETYSIADMESQFLHQSIKPDFVIDGGVLPKIPPSTIVDCSGLDIQILRQGSTRIGQEFLRR